MSRDAAVAYLPNGADVAAADVKYMRQAVAEAQAARDEGNHPFGAVLVDGAEDKVILTARNSVVTGVDITAHAELNLVRAASKLDGDVRRRCILYTSTEPCYWSGIRCVVFGIREATLYGIIADPAAPALRLPSRDVFAAGRKPGFDVAVRGPVEEEASSVVHIGFWSSLAH